MTVTGLKNNAYKYWGITCLAISQTFACLFLYILALQVLDILLGIIAFWFTGGLASLLHCGAELGSYQFTELNLGVDNYKINSGIFLIDIFCNWFISLQYSFSGRWWMCGWSLIFVRWLDGFDDLKIAPKTRTYILIVGISGATLIALPILVGFFFTILRMPSVFDYCF